MSILIRRSSTSLLLLLAACAGAGEEDAEGPDVPSLARVALTTASAPFGDAPQLFSSSSGASRLFELYLPQPDGSARRVSAAPLCEAAQLQAQFGIADVQPVEQLASDAYAALYALDRPDWEFPCDAEKPLFVQRSAADVAWRVALAHGEAPSSPESGDADAGVVEPPSFVVSVPQSCLLLIEHFQVAARAREQRGEPARALPDVDLFLPCRPPPPPTPTGGWSAEIVLGGDMRPLVQLSRGEHKLYLQRVDGVVPSADSQEPNIQVLDAVGALFAIPVGERNVSLAPVPMPALALDVCATQKCDAFVPSHLFAAQGMLVCSDGSVPDLQGACPRTAPELSLEERIAEDGALVQDVKRSDDPSFHGTTFASCSGESRWARVLGLRVRALATPFVAAARAAYLERRTEPVLPCVRDTGCTVELAPGTDLSSPAVLRSVARSCWRGEDVLTLRLLGSAEARGTLTLRSAALLPTSADALPASITTVRLVGAEQGLAVKAPARLCGTALCQTETPALSVRGPLRVELEGITLQASPASTTLPGNRTGIEAKEGATLVLRDTAVGAEVTAATPPPAQLFTGVRLSDATLFAARSQVRAFATAIDATRAQLVVLGNARGARSQLSALAGTRAYAELKNLAGRPMAQASNFVALRVGGSGARAFLGGADLMAPVGILYLGPGAGEGDVSVLDTYLRWNADCAGRLFETESHALELAGNGELRLGAVDVAGHGTLLRCPAPAQTTVVFEGSSTFGAFRQRTDFGACRVSTEFALRTQSFCTPSTLTF